MQVESPVANRQRFLHVFSEHFHNMSTNRYKRNFIIQLSDDDRASFQAFADGAHMEDTKLAAVWIRELSRVRPEFALKVLGLIPDEWKHRRPGRPPSTARASNVNTPQLPAQDVA